MKGCGLAASSGSDHEHDPVRFLDHLRKNLVVPFTHRHFFKGQGLAGCQKAHDHIFIPTGGRDCGHAEFDVQGREFLEFDFSVLGEPPLCDVELRHDLDSGNERSLVRVRDRLIELAGAVNPDPDVGMVLPVARLDVNVRSVPVVGVDDHLVDKLNNGAVFLTHLVRIFGALFLGRFKLSEDVFDAAPDSSIRFDRFTSKKRSIILKMSSLRATQYSNSFPGMSRRIVSLAGR